MMKLWLRQTAAIAGFELKRFLLARRWIGVYVMALAPVLLMYARAKFAPRGVDPLSDASTGFAALFQFFIMRFGIFIGSAVVFTQVFRGDILEKTLHVYLLAPVRREILAAGKYIAGVALVGFVFGAATSISFLLRYWRAGLFDSFFLEGPGFSHLIRYVSVAVLATIGYGAVFLLVGLVFKNPGAPILLYFGWESFSFALPSMLQKFSIAYYLTPILPVKVDAGPFAIVTDPVSPVAGIPIVIAFAIGLIAVSGLFVRTLQITYSAD